MKIGFDAKRLFNNFTGLGNYSRTLVADLQQNFPENEYFLFTSKTKKSPRTLPFLNNEKFNFIQPKSGGAFWRSSGMVREQSFQNLDIYHGLSHEIPFGIQSKSVKSVVTIHDLIFKYYPKDYKFADRLIYNQKFKFACQNADRIIAISEQTKADIIRYYGTPQDKIKVIFQGCDPIFAQPLSSENKERVIAQYKLPENYFLFVGSIISRKNLSGVVKALSLIPETEQIPLVVIGEGARHQKVVMELIQKLQLENLVIWLRPDFQDFPAIYAGAKSLVLPSFYEGFGIPILEAMSAGIPVITSNQSSLAEVGGDAAILIDPADIKAISEAMRGILSDETLASDLSKKGKKRSKLFDRVAIAQKVMEVYQELV